MNEVKINKPQNSNNKPKISKRVVGVILIFVIILFFRRDSISQSIEIRQAINEYKDKVTSLFQQYNIDEVRVEVRLKEKDYISVYGTNVYSDEFANLSDEDKFNILEKFESMDLRSGVPAFIGATEQIIHSNNNQYTYFSMDGVRKISMNGKTIYSVGTPFNTQSSSTSDTSDTTISYTLTPTDDEKGFAWAVAKREVKNILKSPSTAKFPFSYYNETIKKASGNKFQVKSYVEAQNSFGAMVKTNFIVEFEKTGEDSYILLDVSLIE